MDVGEEGEEEQDDAKAIADPRFKVGLPLGKGGEGSKGKKGQQAHGFLLGMGIMRANGADAKKPARGGLCCESNQLLALMQQALAAIYLIALCSQPGGAAALLQALHAGCGHVQQFGAGAHAFTVGNIAHQAGPGGGE